MSAMDPGSALRRLGSARPLVLVVVYTLGAFGVTTVGEIAGAGIVGSTLVRILALMLLSLLFVTVTWFRSDDWLAAGVLITLTVYAATAVPVTVLVTFREGIGPAALWSAATAGGAIVTAIVFAPIAGGLVALARKLTPKFRAAA